MGKSICGAKCESCSMNKTCCGCTETNGCPFGKQCFIASYINIGGMENFNEFKAMIIDEFNSLQIPGMPRVEDLNALNGGYVNLEYTLPSGQKVKYLDDCSIYLGNQLECEFCQKRCFGIVAGLDFLLVCTYEENGANPELIIYKKR